MYRVRINTKTIWEAIARQNLSQNEFAIKLGVSSSYMSQLICGTRSPSPKLRRKMLEILVPLTFDDLFVVEAKNGCQN